MKQIVSTAKWHEAWLDTPIDVPRDRVRRAHELRDPEYLADTPGVHLKTCELGPDGFPAMYGKLASHDEDANRVVVHSKPDCLNNELQCVWIGTTSEYLRMWRVD